MSGKWLLASNGRAHWFRSERASVSACGSMLRRNCWPESSQEKLDDYPCATCKKYEKKARTPTLEEVYSNSIRNSKRVSKVADELVAFLENPPADQGEYKKLKRKLFRELRDSVKGLKTFP